MIINAALARRVWRMLPLVAFVATGGCFATRNDVRIVQTDIASLRTELLKNDVAQRETLAQAMRLLAAATDSLARLSARTVSIQGDVRGETRAIKEQLFQVLTLLGQSQSTMTRLRAEMEARNNAAPVTPPVTTPPTGAAPPLSSGTNTAGVIPPADTTARSPGPAQLYTNALDQQRRGSTSTARTLFQQLLTEYPTSDNAPDAQFYIGQSYLTEKNYAAADAAFGAVVTKYPESSRASTSLYKRGEIAVQQGNKPDARKFFNDVIARYPKSTEASLAADRLLEIR